MSSSDRGAVLRLGSLNVHNWEDANYEDNVERIANLVNSLDLDLLCMQECPAGHDLTRFHQFTGGEFKSSVTSFAGGFGVAVLTRVPAEKRFPSKGKLMVRAVTSEVKLEEKPLFLTSTHLDYRNEPLRLTELGEMTKKLSDLFSSDSHQIWTGDFNALTREDYDESTWEEIATVRRNNSWESPKTELTEKVKSLGFVDCWEKSGRPSPYETCRFDTRIDYVFASASFLRDHPLLACRHVLTDATDHNMVVAEFKK